MKRYRVIMALALLVSACADTSSTSSPTATTRPPATSRATTPPSSTTVPIGTTTGPVTTTSLPATTTTEPAPPIPSEGLDVPYVINGIYEGELGLFTSDGILLAAARPPLIGTGTLARDHDGGFVYLDERGLYWLPAGAVAPSRLVAGRLDAVIEVIPSASGGVVRYARYDDSGSAEEYVDLRTGQPVSGDGLRFAVEFAEDGMIRWTAANGLTAWLRPPVLTADGEGFVDEVLAPAALVVEDAAGTVLLDVPFGNPMEYYATIHDFDGQHLIVSRLPEEPALPDETFAVIDLACPECTTWFRAGATSASLTGADRDWAGPIDEPELARCSSAAPVIDLEPQAGLPFEVRRQREFLARTLASCLLRELAWRQADGFDSTLGHGGTRDPADWGDDLAAIAHALTLPYGVTGEGHFVWPASFAADDFDAALPAVFVEFDAEGRWVAVGRAPR